MSTSNRLPSRRQWLGNAAAASALAAWPAWADDYPSRPLKLVVPFAPGGATDVVARIVSQKLAEALKQPVVVENRPGANGAIGTEAVARAAPDGYTLLLNTAGAQTLTPFLQKTGYEPLASFTPISLISTVGLVLVVNPAVPANTLQELVELIKSKKRPMSYSAGSSIIALIGEQFKATLGASDLLIASYKGTGPQLQAVVSGEVDMTVDPFNGLQLIRSGKIRPLAMCGPKRSPSLPQVPTMQELGLPDMTFASWAGLLAPAGTGAAIVRRLHAEVTRIVALPEVRDALLKVDYEPVAGTPEQFAATISEDAARWARLVKASNFKVSS